MKYTIPQEQYVLDFIGDEASVTVKTAADLTNKLLQISSGAIYEDGEGTGRPGTKSIP